MVSPNALDETAHGGHLSLRVGETVSLTLPENPTTGYRWVVESPLDDRLTLQEDPRPPSAPTPPGAPSSRHWTLHATAPGQATLDLAYRRPFQPAAPSHLFHLTLQIDPQ